MFILQQAASERADASTNHRITLSGLAPDEAEKICLLAEILGWETETARASACEAGNEAKDSPDANDGFLNGRSEERRHEAWTILWNERGRDAFRLQDGDAVDWLGASSSLAPPATHSAPARLALRQIGTVIRAHADDPDVRQQLARQGLDRMVSPVPLLALERLLTLAA